MGRWAVRFITMLDSAVTLFIADVDLGRAQRMATEAGGATRPVRLDATDGREMRTLFRQCDVVLNTLGPFAKFARPVLEAALDCDCHYLDIDDDWQSTLEGLKLDAEARRRGLRVVKGLGGSPGSSNLLAILAARQLDRVDDLFTGWSMWGAVPEEEPNYPLASGSASAAVEHWLLQCSGTVPVWRNGRSVKVTPLERIELDYPGIGPADFYSVGHPEPVTLPQSIPTLQNSMNVMSGPEWIFENVRRTAAEYDNGEVNLKEGAAALANPTRPTRPAPRDPMPAVWALARGQVDERPKSVSVHFACRPPGKMGGNTGLPLAIGLELLRRGEIEGPGVRAPEDALDADRFFELFGQVVGVDENEDLLAFETLPWAVARSTRVKQV